MLQPPVPSLPPMAPASGSADHAVSGARSGRQVLPLAAAGFWTRLAGHGDDDSCPRGPGTPRWRRACSGECTCRAHGVTLVVGEWCWATRPRSEYSQRGQFHSPHSHVLPSRCHTAAAPSVSVRADLCRPQHRPQVLRPRGEPKSAEGAAGRPGTRSQPSTHGLARGSGAFKAAAGLPATDERRLDDSGSRRTRPPAPASTPAAVSRIRCWSRQQQPGDGPRERVRHGQTAGLLGGILPQGVLVEGFGGRRHHLQVPKRGTLRCPLRGGWGAAKGGSFANSPRSR